MQIEKLTLTQSTVAMVVLLGVFTVVLYIWVAHRHHGWRRSYLPFIDLLSYSLTGLAIIVGISSALATYADEFPRNLAAAGKTNIGETYRPAYQSIRERYEAECKPGNAISIDCAQMQRFFQGSTLTSEEDVTFVVFDEPLADDTAPETRELITDYNQKVAATPRMSELLGGLFGHLGWLALPLWVGFALGFHRRWILYRQALGSGAAAKSSAAASSSS